MFVIISIFELLYKLKNVAYSLIKKRIGIMKIITPIAKKKYIPLGVE